YRDAQLVVSRRILVGGAELPLDHAGRAPHAVAEGLDRAPREAMGVVPLPHLHGAVVEDAHEVELAITRLDQSRAAERDVRAEVPSVGPGEGRAVDPPPVVEAAIGGAHDHLEVAGGAVIALNERRDARGVGGAEGGAVTPGPGGLIEIPV